MSLVSNFGGRYSGGMSGGGRRIIGGASNQKSAEEVAAEKAFEMNFEILTRELPDLVNADAKLAVELARNSADTNEMIEVGLKSMTAVQMKNMLERTKEMSDEEQRGAAALMPRAKREAMIANGWSVPQEDDGGFWGGVKGVLGSAARPVAGAVGWGMKLPIISQGLKAMDYAAEEAGRFNRVAPTAQSSNALLEQTGLTPEELQAQTGIEAIGAGMSDYMRTGEGEQYKRGAFAALHLPDPRDIMNVVTNPSDIWKAVQVWDAVGHEGDDDYLPELQYKVWEDLEAGLGEGKGKDALRWAKKMAAGATVEEIAADEGLSGDQAERFKQEVGLLSSTDAFRLAMSKLEGGRMSAGRNVARIAYNDSTLDTREGGARILSGSVDAVYSVVADPTMALGAASKATKAARWGMRSKDSLQKLNRWQEGVRILDKVEAGAMTAEEARDAVKGLGGGARYILGNVHEMEAVRAPAKAIQKALKEDKWGELVEQYPGMMRSIEDIKDYNNTLKAANLPSIEEDASQVFEFFKEATQNVNVLRSADEVARQYSTKLFGHDGKGHLFIPKMTQRKHAVLTAKASMKKVLFGDMNDIPVEALDDLKAAADEAHIELAKETGRDVDEAIAETADMEIDKVTGAYQAKKPNWLQERLHQTYVAFTAPTTTDMFIHLENNLAPEEFQAYNRMMGFIERASPATVHARFDAFVNADQAGRHLLVQDLTNKMITSTGMTRTKEGQELLVKYGLHENHIYGYQDALRSNKMLAAADEQSARRLITRNAYHTGQLAPKMQVPSMRELVIASRKTAGLRMVGGTIRKSHLEAAMSNVWKPLSIMRLAFPIRSGFDEAILHVMRVGSWDYVRAQTLEKWAGIRQMEMTATGLKFNPEGAIKPLKTFTRTLASMTGATDKGIAERVAKEVTSSRAYAAAVDVVEQEAMVAKAVKEAIEANGKGTLGRIPRAMRGLMDTYDTMSLRSSEAFSKITRDAKIMKRSEWAQFALNHTRDGARRKMLYAQASWHPQFQIEQAEVLGHSYYNLKPYESTEGLGSLTKVYSSANDSGWQALPLIQDRNNGWQWAGDDDLSGKYLNLSTTMEKAAQTPETRAAIYQLRHHVPQSVLDEVSGVAGVNGMEALHELRDVVALDEDVRKLLTRAATSEADAASIRQTIEAIGDLDPEAVAAVGHIIDSWDDLSLEARQFVTDNSLVSSMLTDDFETVQNRAANAVYNALRTLDRQSDLRGLIRAQIVDNDVVARPLKAGHARVYAPMVDRRTAEEIVQLFQDESMMQTFAERLSAHLSERGLKNQMNAVWDAAPVDDAAGYTLASWMAGLKGAIAQGDGAYATALMAGSSNYAVAEAMRDALNDVLSDKMLQPTVGFFDFPESATKYQASGIRQVNDTVVSLQPHHATKFEAITPDRAVRQLHVQMANGDKLWVGENELSSIGRVARMEDVQAASTFGSDRMVFWDRNSKKVKFNSKLVNDDYRNGMKFLRGEGGDFSEMKAAYGWADEEYADAARRMEAQLNSLGLAENVNATLDDMIGWQKTRHMHDDAPIPLEGAMKDNGLWEDFLELSGAAKKSGQRTTRAWTDEATRTQSQIVKAALDEMGITIAAPRKARVVAATNDAMDAELQALLADRTVGMNESEALQDLLDQAPPEFPGLPAISQKEVVNGKDAWDMTPEELDLAAKNKLRKMQAEIDLQKIQEIDAATAAAEAAAAEGLQLTRRQYRSLLIEREKAHRALDPAGFGRPTAFGREAIEREKDALAIAFQRAGIDADDLLVTKEVDLVDRIRQAETDGETELAAQLTEELNNLPQKPSTRMQLAVAKEKNDYRVIGEIWGNGKTEEAAVRRASQHILDEMNNLFVGQESGQVLHSIAGPLLRGEHSMDNLWRKVELKELPHKAHGPTRVVAATNTWRDHLNRIFDDGLNPMIGSISRAPMYMYNFDTAMATFEHVRENLIVRSLDDKARSILARTGVDPKELDSVHDMVFAHLETRPDILGDEADEISRYAKGMWDGDVEKARTALSDMAGKPVDLTDDEILTLSSWHKNLSQARKAQVNVAVPRATELTVPYIDDHRLRSVFQEVLGPVVLPYFYAEEQFLRRFARTLLETPQALRKGQLLMNGMRNVGVVRKDKYGNEYLVIPGSEILMGVAADVATAVTGNEAFQVLDQPLSMRTDFVLPGWNTQQSRWGWGPIIGLSVDKMTQRYPEYEWRTEPPNRKWWEYVVPGPVAGAYKAFVQDIDPAQLASAQMDAIAHLEELGKTPDENATATEKEEYLADLRSLTRNIGILRYMTGQVGFTGMTPKDWHADALSSEFQEILASGVDISEATDIFLKRHGDEAIGYTMFATNNEVGAPLPSTEPALRYMLEHEEEIINNPTAMAWFLPQEETDGPFDRRAYNEAMALGLRSKKAPEEMLNQIYVKQAAESYFEKKDAYDSQRSGLQERRDAAKGGERKRLQEELNQLDDEWTAEKDSYLAMHPVFAESFSPDASKRRQETLTDLEWMIAAGLGGEQGDVIGPLVDRYWSFQREYSAIKGTSKQAKEAKNLLLRENFNWMWEYQLRNPKAAPFFNSVVRLELPDQADTLYDEAKGTTA